MALAEGGDRDFRSEQSVSEASNPFRAAPSPPWAGRAAAMESSDCPICLDALLAGTVELGCSHHFHAACLLAYFDGEPSAAWQCPCCRAAVLGGARRSRPAAPAAREDKGGGAEAREDKGAASPRRARCWPARRRAAPRAPSPSRFLALQGFLAAAAAALGDAERGGGEGGRAHARAAEPPAADSRGARLVAALERACPAAAQLGVNFAAEAGVQRLLRPDAPHPGFKLARCAGAALLLAAAAPLTLAATRAAMEALGAGVCAAAEWALGAARGGAPPEGACVPMAPDGWLFPAAFLAMAALIAAQAAAAAGVPAQRALLHLDRFAWRALLLWWGAAAAYLAFIYAVRLALTLALGAAAAMRAAAPGPLTREITLFEVI